ncbi:IclR family transcriptional regulator [Nonomuraea soli]|uniref:DNA-binding IclR family transcriptional regulator n=1 Tax=Nonomuraea soli TaxID=1032476 RepID=A0A7W0CGJ2_9ACTN|nr:IclR family transcriptional regulator [Nonomuraea soli]MBA2890624.1 DNA-binding IclR family transcriptional regulator [Nonomuraea soli]
MPRIAAGSSLDRAIDLLVGLSGYCRPLTLTQLCRDTGLPKSTAHRLLGVLCARGLAKRASTGYLLGDLLTAMTSERIPGSRALVLPFLLDLYETTRQTVNVAVSSGLEVVYVERLYGHNRVPSPSDDHDRAPLHCTAAGKVLLAYDDDLRKALFEHGTLPRMTTRTLPGHGALDRELSLVRRHGLAYGQEEYALGLTCVAAPVFGPGGGITMAVAVAGPTASMRLGRIGIAVRGAAQAISTAMAAAA